MPYRIAGIDVHKRMLAVVVSDVEIADEYQFERRVFGSNPADLQAWANWLVEQHVEEVVMESTAQYWKPVWGALERYWKPVHPKWGPSDVGNAALGAGAVEPRTLTRAKDQQRRNRVQMQSRLEALLEEAHIKLSSWVSDLLGVSARRVLKALADGETDPAVLAALADYRLRAPKQLRTDALGACRDLHPVYRRLMKAALDELELIEKQIGQFDQEIADLLRPHQDAVERLAEVPGLGVDSAQQIIAQVGAEAATFPSEGDLASWVGACPGDNESAGVSYGHRSPKGNRPMRRILNQAANAAIKHKGSIFEVLYRRYVPRLGHNQTIGVIAHRLCRLVWKILHRGVRYEERGPAVSKRSSQKRAARMIRELRRLGYRIEFPISQPVTPA